MKEFSHTLAGKALERAGRCGISEDEFVRGRGLTGMDDLDINVTHHARVRGNRESGR